MTNADGRGDLARDVLAFVATTPFEAVPAAVRDRLKQGWLDVLGAAIRGVQHASRHGRSGAGRQWWWHGTAIPLREAAYRNALAIHDGDPVSSALGASAATCGWTAPAVLTAGVDRHRGGRDTLVAAAVGAELALRLGAAAGPTLSARGLHLSAIGMLGVTAATARLLAAAPAHVGRALGIAACGTPSALLAAYQRRASVARTYLAHATAQAVRATEMAVSGVRGPNDWIGPWFTALIPGTRPDPLTTDLGERWRAAEAGEPMSARLAATATALARAARAESIDHREIESIVVHGGGLAALQVYDPDPAWEPASVPIVVARALLGTVAPSDHPELRRLHRRVQLAGFGQARLGMTLRTVSGRQLCVDEGESAPDALARFRATGEEVLGRARTEALIDHVLRLETLDDVSALLAGLSGPAAATAGPPPPAPSRCGGDPAQRRVDPAQRRVDPDSHAIARFVAGTRFSGLPASVVAAVKRSVLDAIGCARYGQAAPTVALARADALAHTRLPPALAATLVNGTAIHTTELSESFTRAAVHPGTSVVPAIIAVGEREEASGQEVIAAVAVGYEVAIRVGLAFGGILLSQGLHSPTLAGAFGAAAGTARLLHLDADAAGHALAITACRIPSAMWAAAFQHAGIKDMFQAHAAALAIEAADLAAAGETGPGDWLPRWFAAVPRQPQLDGLTETLGEFWWVSSGGLHYKDLPVMAMAAPTLGALRQILQNAAVAPGTVDRVVVESSGRIALNRTYPPASVISARGSIPFLVAAVLHHPQDFLADPYFLGVITEERIRDRRLDALAERVELRVDPRFDAHMEHAWPLRFEARVTIHLDSGAALVGYDDTWQRTSTMQYEDVARKFRAICNGILAAQAVESTIDQVRRLDDLDSVQGLAAMLAPAH